jgi:hypothetical protein
MIGDVICNTLFNILMLRSPSALTNFVLDKQMFALHAIRKV